MTRQDLINNLKLYYDLFEAPYYSPLYQKENRKKFINYALKEGISYQCINIMVACARQLEQHEEKQLMLEQRIKDWKR